MRRLLALTVMLGIGLALAAVAAGEDDYGGGYGTGTTATTQSSGGAGGEVYKYRAPMNAAQEVPRPTGAAAAKGLFTATVNESASAITLKWKLTFSGLTGKAVAAHIHKGKPGKAGDVVVPLCGPCRSGQTGTAKLKEVANDLIERGSAYVNVHTPKNQAGEIRGQVKLAAGS